MRAEIRLTVDALEIDATIVNATEGAIYLVDRLHHGEHPPEIRPELAYVDLRPDVRCVEVAKRVPVVPDGVQVYRRINPYPTRLDPGERIEERVRVPLPVAPASPYVWLDPRTARPARYGSVRFRQQFFRPLPDTFEERVTVEGVELLQLGTRSGRRHTPEWLSSGFVALDVPVLEAPEAQQPEDSHG